jgi:hypothetical protein
VKTLVSIHVDPTGTRNARALDQSGTSERQDRRVWTTSPVAPIARTFAPALVEVGHDERGPVAWAGGEGFAPRCEQDGAEVELGEDEANELAIGRVGDDHEDERRKLNHANPAGSSRFADLQADLVTDRVLA